MLTTSSSTKGDGWWSIRAARAGRVRTVAIPLWVKQGINAWMIAAKIEEGRLLRPLSKSGKLISNEHRLRWNLISRLPK